MKRLCVLLDIQFQPHRAVIGSENLGIDGRGLDAVAQTVGDQKIVNAPACVVLPRVIAVAPPGICPRKVGVAVAERIRETGGEQLVELAAFLVGKTGVAAVRAGIFQVDLVVCNVQIAADDNRLYCVQRAEMLAERILPSHAVVDALQAVLRVGRVAGEKVKFRVFQRDDAPLMIEFLDSEPIGDVQRRALGENRRAGIAFFLGRVLELLIAWQIKLDLMRLRLGFLQAENVRIYRVEHVLEALL